jgi:hypothetical protein
MDEFADLNENSVLALTAVLLLMAIWACVIVAMDHWVWADHSDSPPERPHGSRPRIATALTPCRFPPPWTVVEHSEYRASANPVHSALVAMIFRMRQAFSRVRRIGSHPAVQRHPQPASSTETMPGGS